MNIEKHIGDLLFYHECVIVPGFAAFITHQKSASINPVHHQFFPPSKDIAFNKNITNNDGVLANYIAKKETISFVDALVLIKNFVDESNSTLQLRRRLELPSLGVLFLDFESKLNFEPYKNINYNIEAFGLSSFVSPAIFRSDLKFRIEQKIKKQPLLVSERKSYRTVRKIAAVTIPIAALCVWGMFSLNSLESKYSNFFSYVPFIKHSEKKANMVEYRRPFAVIKQNSIRPTTTILSENYDDVKTSETGSSYFIVGGCFKSYSNAEKFAHQLKNKGFKSELVGQNEQGLYRVAYGGFATQEAADQQLENIRKSENPKAWVLEKK